eukprot:TRINITY_DN3379_c0_g1_i2.p1 TRINITY_DN3379_c0_g1~~TRINITY_DN3379_c0_g1_i2.p1  ORF type:complete len:146 (-),score=29.53 TRINITY_DN3379_c0_g1_i2:824-1261(-)
MDNRSVPYVVRIVPSGSSYLPRSSLPAKQLAMSIHNNKKVNDEVKIYLNEGGHIISFEYSLRHGEPDNSGKQDAVDFNTEVTVDRAQEGTRPDSDGHFYAAEAKKAESKGEEEPSFFWKYWYIIVPVGVIVLLQVVVSMVDLPAQ